MFTGIIQAVSVVTWPVLSGLFRLQLGIVPHDWEPWATGESLAVNGCCLTVLEPLGNELSFNLSEETLSRTTLGSLRQGHLVNLERAMRVGDRLGGHIVQGHVDAIGELVSVSPETGIFRFRVPSEHGRYLIDKGSITIDGISLTVVEPNHNEFEVAVIPHTLAATNLATRQPGDRVNLEFDVIAKHVERLLAFRQ